MADNKKISELTQNPSINGTEETATERGGANYKNTWNDLKTWVLDGLNIGVQTVTGDGVNNTDPSNPVLAFPNADQVDDSATTNKFATGTNTGDETTATIQSKRPLKTVSSKSLEGTGDVVLDKSDVGLNNVDNTSDANKPVSTATQTALDTKTNKALTQTLISSTPKVIVSTDSDTTFNVFGVGALCEFTINTGSLSVGEAFEINLGDADGVDIVGGAGVNIFGAITGSTTLGDSVLVRRITDNSFGLTGEVYKVY